jgi:hypothetical protein
MNEGPKVSIDFICFWLLDLVIMLNGCHIHNALLNSK